MNLGREPPRRPDTDIPPKETDDGGEVTSVDVAESSGTAMEEDNAVVLNELPEKLEGQKLEEVVRRQTVSNVNPGSGSGEGENVRVVFDTDWESKFLSDKEVKVQNTRVNFSTVQNTAQG